MTITAPTTANYAITIPIYSSLTVFLEDVPTDLTDTEILKRITWDDLRDAYVYPEKEKEYASEGEITIKERSHECIIEKEDS